MQGIAKAILVTIITTAMILVFINLAFFFPWYLTLVIETYNVSQVVAGDNYLKQSSYEDALEKLQERPIFRDKADKIEITVVKKDMGYSLANSNAIGNDDATYYYDLPEADKPYQQRGKSLEVEIKAVYPFSITLWGKPLEREMPVSFSMTTTGLKHYKDLDYY